jgi:tripartite-type tricarboxylate transporter receptor subunit TctC
MAALGSASVRAQDTYPSKTITMIVPFVAGGSTDLIGRLVAEGLRTVLGQTVVVENRGGAGGSVGTVAIAKAAPDGYTIGMGTASTLAINPATYKSLPFDVLQDLVPIGNIAAVPNIMSVHPGVKAATMAEFIALAKSQPGKLSYASPGYGSVGHLLGEQFKLATGTDILHVSYRGMGPALNDAVGGQVQVVYDNLPTSLELVKSGKLRGLGLSGEKRVAALPDVPTFGELGLDDLNWMAFFGLIAPKDTPAPIVRRLNEALVRVLAMPEMRDKLEGQQAIVVGNSPEAFKVEIGRELARFKRAATAARIELN